MEREKYVTVSAKIPNRLRIKMRRLGISPSTIFKEAIEEAIVHEKFKKLSKELEGARELFKKIPIEEVVEGIRQDRDSR